MYKLGRMKKFSSVHFVIFYVLNTVMVFAIGECLSLTCQAEQGGVPQSMKVLLQ